MSESVEIKTCLVTGGAGFIGSHLVSLLLKSGYRVRVFDNFSTGERKNLAPYLHQIELMEGDIRHLEQVKIACRDMDAIFHQAAVASVNQSITAPHETHQINVDGTVNILEAARLTGVRKVIFASSAAVYGDCAESSKSEAMRPSPVSPYGLHKRVGEEYCEIYSRLFGLQTTCLRYFNVFGPNQNPHSPYSGVISIFIDAILSGKNPTLYGDGQQSRDFVFVSDICKANLYALQQQETPFEIFNVGSGHGHNLLELLSYIDKYANRHFSINYQAERRGDPRHSLADISKIQSVLNFRPETSFEDGLRELVMLSAALKQMELPEEGRRASRA